MKRKRLFVLLIGVLGLTACGKTNDIVLPSDNVLVAETADKSINDTTEEPLEQQQEVIEESTAEQTETVEEKEQKDTMNIVELDNNVDKSVYLLDKLYKAKTTNVLMSPLSLNMALGMVNEGATGSTKQCINGYLGTDNYSAIAQGIIERYSNENVDTSNSEESYYEGNATAMNVANSVWVNDNRIIKEDFKKTVQSIYNADVDTFNADDSIGSANKINTWVDGKTHGLISELIDPMQITPATSMALVNTVYFKDSWEADTWVEYGYSGEVNEFTNIDNTVSKDKLIINYDAMCCYETDKAEAFEVRYDSGMRFIGILPKVEGDFDLADLDINALLNANTTDNYTEIHAIMPEFKYETDNDILTKELKNVGLAEIFTPEAHFENLIELAPNEKHYVSDVIQKCTIDVDRYGTEASAATAILMKFESAAMFEEPIEPIIKEIKLDRPFAYLIMDADHTQVVFMGKVVNLEA